MKNWTGRRDTPWNSGLSRPIRDVWQAYLGTHLPTCLTNWYKKEMCIKMMKGNEVFPQISITYLFREIYSENCVFIPWFDYISSSSRYTSIYDVCTYRNKECGVPPWQHTVQYRLENDIELYVLHIINCIEILCMNLELAKTRWQKFRLFELSSKESAISA
jgi:hypothetical protein